MTAADGARASIGWERLQFPQSLSFLCDGCYRLVWGGAWFWTGPDGQMICEGCKAALAAAGSEGRHGG